MLFDALYRSEMGPTIGGNHNLFSCILRLRNLNRMSVPKNTLNPSILEAILLNSVQTFDLPLKPLLEEPKTKLDLFSFRNSKMSHIMLQHIRNTGGTSYDLFGDAVDVDAGASKAGTFDAEDCSWRRGQSVRYTLFRQSLPQLLSIRSSKT